MGWVKLEFATGPGRPRVLWSSFVPTRHRARMSTVTDWNETTSDDESDDTAPPSLPHEESVAEIGDDATMDFASGSVVFSISGVRFKVRMTRI